MRAAHTASQNNPDVSTRSITVEVLDDQVVMELEVEGNFYRAEKLHLYHDQVNLSMGKGCFLGAMGVTKMTILIIFYVTNIGREKFLSSLLPILPYLLNGHIICILYGEY